MHGRRDSSSSVSLLPLHCTSKRETKKSEVKIYPSQKLLSYKLVEERETIEALLQTIILSLDMLVLFTKYFVI